VNQEIKSQLEAQASHIRSLIHDVEQDCVPEISEQLPKLKAVLLKLENSKKECPRTYGDRDEPEIHRS